MRGGYLWREDVVRQGIAVSGPRPLRCPPALLAKSSAILSPSPPLVPCPCRYFAQIEEWVAAGDIRAPEVSLVDGIGAVAEAQSRIQSGLSVGKIVVQVACSVEGAR